MNNWQTYGPGYETVFKLQWYRANDIDKNCTLTTLSLNWPVLLTHAR